MWLHFWKVLSPVLWNSWHLQRVRYSYLIGNFIVGTLGKDGFLLGSIDWSNLDNVPCSNLVSGNVKMTQPSILNSSNITADMGKARPFGYSNLSFNDTTNTSWKVYIIHVQLQLVWGLSGVTHKQIRAGLTQTGQYQTNVAVDWPNRRTQPKRLAC